MLRKAVVTLVTSMLIQIPAVASSSPGSLGVSEENFLNQPSAMSNRRRALGHGALFSNDIIGDGQGRLHTGLIWASGVHGYGWTGDAPSRLGELWTRDSVSGQRYRAICASGPRTSFVLGGDITCAADSVCLPKDGGNQIETARGRLRAGVHWQGKHASAFYGLTYLERGLAGHPTVRSTGHYR